MTLAAEDATRALMWIRYWLNSEERADAGVDLAPLMEELQERVSIEMLLELSGVEES